MTGRYDRPRLSTARLSARRMSSARERAASEAPRGPWQWPWRRRRRSRRIMGCLLWILTLLLVLLVLSILFGGFQRGTRVGGAGGHPRAAGYRGGAGHAALVTASGPGAGWAGGRVGHSLAGILDQAAEGRYPPTDGGVTILAAQPSPRAAGVIAFTAHAVIFIDADAEWVAGPAAARRPVRAAHPGVPGRALRAHRAARRRAPTCWAWRRRCLVSRTSTSGAWPPRLATPSTLGWPGLTVTATTCGPGRPTGAS